MAMTSSPQAAAEYVALVGRNAAVSVQSLSQSAMRFVDDNPELVAVAAVAFVLLIWLTRARTR